MTPDRESTLFEFANSKSPPTNEEEQIVTDIHAALGMNNVPIRLMRPPAVSSGPRWNRHLFAMAALMLVLALATASFVSLQPESDGVPTEVPPVVLGLASQAPATPVAESCDFSGTVPFIAGMDKSPLDEPTLLHRLDRSLVLDCNGEQTELLEEVQIVRPTQTAHVVHASTADGDYLINIDSNEQLFIPAKTDPSTASINFQPWGPWLVMRSSTDGKTASVYNLESMTETQIVTHARVPLTLEDVTEAAIHADDNRLVLAYPYISEAGTKYLHGFFVVEADGSSNVIAVGQEAFPRELAVSPDGQIMATASFHGTRGDGTTTVTLFGTKDDEVIEQYELTTMDQPVELAWQHDGSGLLLHDTYNLYRIDAEHPGDGLELLAEGENLQSLMLTPDNDVVAISSFVASTTPSTSTLIVHIPTGEVTALDGQDLMTNPYITSTRTTLVLEVGEPRPGQQRTMTMVDAVSGETIGTVEFEPVNDSGFNSSAYGMGDGHIIVVAFRPDSLWRLVDAEGNATLEQIPTPPIDEDTSIQGITILTSNEGHVSLRIVDDEMSTSIWILQPGSAEWIELDMPPQEETPGMIPSADFVVGNSD